MPGRSFSTPSYRFGYNGKEKDDEVKGGGAQYDYGFRIYDPRLGKFLSVDPLTKEYPWNSTYAFAENDVIRCIDLEGLEKFSMIMNFFIPFDKVPVIPDVMDVKGDNRGFDLSGKSDQNRVQVTFNFDIDDRKGSISNAMIKANPSTIYVYDHFLLGKLYTYTGTAEVGRELQYDVSASTTTAGDITTYTIKYTITCKLATPLREVGLEDFAFAPAIDAGGMFRFTKNNVTGEVSFMEGNRIDGFPAYEYFLRNDDNNSQIPILLFTPDQPSDGLNLLPSWGDRTLGTSSPKTIVGAGGNMSNTWGGAKPVTEDETDCYNDCYFEVD